MINGAMAPLGFALKDALTAPRQQTFGDQIAAAPVAPSAPKYSKGQIIAGIIADALAGAAGQQGPMAARWAKERQQADERADWGLKRQAALQDYEAQQQIQQRYKPPEVAPMLRDVQAWGTMTPEQRAAYGEMQRLKEGDPIVTITLPNGQMYSGPRSGLAAAMMGGGAPAAPDKPVGTLRPVGGPTPPASATFPR